MSEESKKPEETVDSTAAEVKETKATETPEATKKAKPAAKKTEKKVKVKKAPVETVVAETKAEEAPAAEVVVEAPKTEEVVAKAKPKKARTKKVEMVNPETDEVAAEESTEIPVFNEPEGQNPEEFTTKNVNPLEDFDWSLLGKKEALYAPEEQTASLAALNDEFQQEEQAHDVELIDLDDPVEQTPDKYHFAEDIEEEESLSLHDKELELIRKSLEKYDGKRKEAAQELGISERTLYRKIKQFNL